MTDKNSKLSFTFLATDFVLLNVAFFAMNYMKRGAFVLSHPYGQLLIAFFGFWLLVSLPIRKFEPASYTRYWNSIRLFARADLFLLFFISFMVVMAGLPGFSRVQIFGTCGLLFIAEAAIFTPYYVFVAKAKAATNVVAHKKKQTYSPFLLISDFFLFILAFFLVYYLKRGTITLDALYEKLLLILVGIWMITAFITRKFDKRHFETYFFAIAPCVKSVIFMALFMATLIFGVRMFYYSRFQIFGFLVLFIGMEMFFWFIYFFHKKETMQDVESSLEARSIMRQEALSVNTNREDIRDLFSQPIQSRLREIYFRDQPRVFDFLNRVLDLSGITRMETILLDTSEPLNFSLISLPHTRLMVNLHKINDIRWINRYFINAHGMLMDGGYLAGTADTIDGLMDRFRKKYPKYFREFFYCIHFVWARVIPKLNATRRIYFNLTKGKRRAVSRSEILGRLCFCGFKIIAEEYVDDVFYFIAQKVKTPSLDESPSYGPLVRFERVGAGGKLIYTYKFRTMHPYSEYLQEYVHEQNQLRDGGKFKDDFRITGYGKIMRKLWLDELPMLYNWMKGDLQFFGVRPLSQQYLNLYDKDLQELRKKVRPGLVPPYYADLPKTFEEICESERRYIQSYFEKPFRTQCMYCCRAFSNIVFKGARSG